MNSIFKKRKNTETPSKDGSLEFILVSSNSMPHSENAEPHFIVKRSIDVIPEWYKKLEPLVSIKGNMDLSLKKCIPFLDSISSGYYLVTATDYEFKADEDLESYSFTGVIEKIDHADYPVLKHPAEQIGDMPSGEDFIRYVFKWNNEYIIKTPPGYSVIFTHPLNYLDLPFYTLSGVVETDTFFMSTLFPFFMKKGFSGTIPAGTPIVQIIPFKREDWKHSVENNPSKKIRHTLSEQFNKYMSDRFIPGNPIPVGGIYKKRYRKQKKYL